ncbi:MAG: cell division protein SepF [Nanoarchaeota archaeon]|nr:cell division protein SepF [Nanoarchaeota archaeon]
MVNFSKKFKDWVNFEEKEGSGEYLEIQTSKKKPSFIVRTFSLNEFDDVKKILKVIRQGTTVVLVDLKPLKENDVIDLRRAVNKLKSTAAEVEGDIAGLSGNWIVITPNPIKIEKLHSKSIPEPEEEEI